MGVALIHVDHGEENVFLTHLGFQKVQSGLKVAAHFFWRELGEVLRRGGDDGVDEFDAVLAHLTLRVFSLRFFNAGLDLAVILKVWLDQVVVEFGALPVDIRIAAVVLFLPLMVLLNGAGRAALALFKSQNCVWHKSKLLSSGLLYLFSISWIS